MNKLLIGIMLVFISSNAVAEWTYFSSTEDFVTYIDMATIRKSGSISSLWTLDDYVHLKTVGGYNFLSTKYMREFDCNKETSRGVALIEYSKNMGLGSVVYSSDDEYVQSWKHNVPDTIAQHVWQIACSKQ